MSQAIILCTLVLLSFSLNAASVCVGTTANGSLRDGVELPRSGENFLSYGSIPRLLGRAYVHSTVRSIVVNAYTAVATTDPETVFVYGETGFKTGGPFKPHKTHQNGLSVDFMMPVQDTQGVSVPMPTSPLSRWGYDLEFDSGGRLESLHIDFEAAGKHIVALHKAAKSHGVDIWRVLFAPDLQDELYATEYGAYIRRHIKIPTKRSWVRHDDHYHVDFAVPCESAG